MDIDEARTRFAVLRGKGSAVSPDELDAVWAALPAVRVEDILGEWRGDEFDTGHPLNGKLEKAGWHGKTFLSVDDAKPLITRGKDGRLYSDTELGKGEASLWMVEFRGESTATMVYDGQPVFDHFKAVDDRTRVGSDTDLPVLRGGPRRTIMGIMNGKGFGEGPFFYFVLERA